jgi:hypothetical protein
MHILGNKGETKMSKRILMVNDGTTTAAQDADGFVTVNWAYFAEAIDALPHTKRAQTDYAVQLHGDLLAQGFNPSGHGLVTREEIEG